MKIRTLIVDDEPLARRNLALLLQKESDFEVVGECEDGSSGAALVKMLKPDLVFLDVQMPTMSGFDLLHDCKNVSNPAVVFVTAFDEFALRAFDVEALDYLLKPFHSDRFERMLARVRQDFAARKSSRLDIDPASPTANQILVKCGDRFVFIALADLEYVRARANYVRMAVGDTTYDVREKIGDMEERLPSTRFVRIHRSYIVNVAYVREITPAGDGDYFVVLRGGRHLPVGPTYTPHLRRYVASATAPKVGGTPQRHDG